MTDHDIVQAISVNLLRMSQWYYLDPTGNKELCERYLDQSKQLSKQVTGSSIQTLLDQVHALRFDESDPSFEHQAERCLTLGVILASARI